MGFFATLRDRASRRALATMAEDENFQFVRRCHLFQDLSPGALVFVMRRTLERRYRRHEPIFKQGNPGICLYLVRAGRVEIFTEEEDDESGNGGALERTVLARVGEGRVFGELSVLSLTYRSTSARALDAGTTLLTLSSYDMDELMARYPQDSVKILRGVTDTLAHNLIDTNRKVQQLRTELQAAQLEIQLLRNQSAQDQPTSHLSQTSAPAAPKSKSSGPISPRGAVNE